MRASLERWIGDADALRHLEHFRVEQETINLAYIRERADDYYIALVGELFELMRDGSADGQGWARLGNALAQFAAYGQEERLRTIGVSKSEATLFAAAAFYCGGFPASAYLTIRSLDFSTNDPESYHACFDLMARPTSMRSNAGRQIVSALRRGDMRALDAIRDFATRVARKSLAAGPDAWIPAHLFERLVDQFQATNIRVVLPDGGSDFWTPYVASMLNRKPPSWEFFPSQIEAIQKGLLSRSDTFSLQMPTGAGKTALCETLLYWHVKRTETDVAILLVPYRSLASELRGSVVKRLNTMGISSRCAYGGTVPSGEEVRALDDTHVIVATPEALSGLLGVDSNFFSRISLVICDEGHLLDGGGRGVGLELLLSRLRSHEGIPPRFIFISSIVPNIEEVNAWLGGTDDSVVRSDYRPALAEFSVLRISGSGSDTVVALEMHPHEMPPIRFTIDGFLSRADFQYTNTDTGRYNIYSFSSIKTQAIAAARKSLGMGVAAVFAANKRGTQGVLGLAEELLDQVALRLSLPAPIDFTATSKMTPALAYLKLEYGPSWIGTRTLAAGAILHHGDIPQETREVVEALLRDGYVRFAICTNTLAEGVNLPIRTLVLYSVKRRQKNGRPENLLARDIKNLVGRAGRAGATTKGLVICANEQQWPQVEQVARQSPGEPIRGALRSLIERLRSALTLQNVTLTNQLLEGEPLLYTLVDGVDATLIDLATEEIGEDALVAEAIRLAEQTFASRQTDPESQQLLQNVFELRARRVVEVRAAGRLAWIRETGARVRLLDAVETELLPFRQTWDDIQDPLDAAFVSLILDWAWTKADIQEAIRDVYRLDDNAETGPVRTTFMNATKAWLAGSRFHEIATRSTLQMDDLLGVHAQVISFVLQTLVEQGVALLAKLIESQGHTLAPAVHQFPEHLRFGVPTAPARVLAAGGVRHRSASVELGNAFVRAGVTGEDQMATFRAARETLIAYRDVWIGHLGELVVENTLRDLTGMIGDGDNEE